MPVIIPTIPFVRHRKPSVQTSATPALTLVSATFDGGTLVLTFDRAIDVAGLVPGQLVVFDGPGAVEWGGTALFEQPTPESLEVTMSEEGEFAGAGVTLTATAGAGIVAADDDSPWAGVTGVELPFP
jgi:hypothetical protein